MNESNKILAVLDIFFISIPVMSQYHPNMVLIVGDDCSFYDISCFGSKNHVTENIDALARSGIKFNRAYNSSSMSTPTRHSLYTGMFPMHHAGYANHSMVKSDVKSMPYYLSKLGYRVGLCGKWDIRPKKNFPFEDVKGFPENCVGNSEYEIDGIKEFVKRNDCQPFCLVVASINSHFPWTAGDNSVYDREKLVLPPYFIDTPSTRENYAKYLAEVKELDRQVGDVVSVLKSENKLYNTLILFVSEQGSKFAGAKWTNWSAGVRSAMIASWYGVIEPGRESNAIVQYEDILPTFIDIAGGKVPNNIDGVSFLNLLNNNTDNHHKYAYHVHNNVPEGPSYPIRSISDGHYRLIWNIDYKKEYVENHLEQSDWFISWKNDSCKYSKKIMERFIHRPEYELYDIVSDPYEMNNLFGKLEYADKVKELKKELKKWMIEQNDSGLNMDK